MEFALQRLQRCHLSSNSPSVSRVDHTRQVKVQATAAVNPPITSTQRALLQTARRKSSQPQGAHVQPLPQSKLLPELRGNSHVVDQLVNSSPEEFERLMLEHERRQQLRLRQQQQQQQQMEQHRQQGRLPTLFGQQARSQRQQQQQQQHQTEQQQEAQAQEAQQPPTAGSYAESAVQLQQRRLLQQQLALRHLLMQQKQRKRQLQLQVRQEPAVLTALIKRSTSWQRLQQLFSSLTPLFNPIHVSAALTHLAQLQEQPLDSQQLAAADLEFKQLVQDLVAAAVACTPDFGPRQVANSLWAIHRLGAQNLLTRRMRHDFLAVFADKLQYAAPQHVALVAAAVANMGLLHGPAWNASVLQAATIRLPYFKPCELAILLHAVPRLVLPPSAEWVDGVMRACYSCMDSFSLQELSMLAVSLVRLQYKPPQDWLVAYLHAVQLQLQQMPQADGAAGDGSWWLGTAAHQHLQPGLHGQGAGVFAHAAGPHSSSSYYASHGSSSTASHTAAAGMSGAAIDHDVHADSGTGDDTADDPVASFDSKSRGVSVQGVVNVLYTLAVWGVAPPGGFQALCLAAVGHLQEDLTIQGVSTLLWACAKLQVQVPQPLLLQLLQHGQPLLLQAQPTDLSMLCWGLGTLGVTAAAFAAQPEGPAVGSSMAAHEQQPALSDRYPSVLHDPPITSHVSSSGLSSDDSDSSSGSEACSWQVSFLRDLVYHSYRLLPSATAADVITMLAGVVRMRLSPGRQWLAAMSVEMSHWLPVMTPVELAGTLLSLARLRSQPSSSFLQAYCMRSEALLSATAAAASTRSAKKRGSVQVIRRRRSSPQQRELQGVSVFPQHGSAEGDAASPSASRAALREQQLYTPQELVNTLGTLAKLDHRPAQQWCDSFFAASAALMPSFTGRDFAYTIWALALLELQPPAAWMDAYLVQLRVHVPTMTSQQLSAVIWALARLDHRPGVAWMNRFLDRVAALSPQPGMAAGAASSVSSSDIGSSTGSASSRSSSSTGDASSSSSSAGGAGVPAPPSPLQLSGYFSAIILQGLTAWAASCLDLGFDGSSNDSSTEDSRECEGSTQPDGMHALSAGGPALGEPSGGLEAVADVQSPGDRCIELEPQSPHRRSIAADGSILFSFD